MTAEPRIVATNLSLLETVTGLQRRSAVESTGPAARQILEAAGIAVTASRVGGYECRRISLEIATGVVRITETPTGDSEP